MYLYLFDYDHVGFFPSVSNISTGNVAPIDDFRDMVSGS